VPKDSVRGKGFTLKSIQAVVGTALQGESLQDEPLWLSWDRDTSPAIGGLSAGKPCPYVKTLLFLSSLFRSALGFSFLLDVALFKRTN